MTSLIKGIQVTLTVRTQTGFDNLNAPIYSESTVTVDNVLVEPLHGDIISTLI